MLSEFGGCHPIYIQRLYKFYYDGQISKEDDMDTETYLDSAEQIVREIHSQHPSTRAATLRKLESTKYDSELRNILLKSVTDGVKFLKLDIKRQRERADRFATIPKFYPAPNDNDADDKLIYSRMIMGYVNAPSGNNGRLFRKALKKFKGNRKYVEYMKSQQSNQLGQPNFHYLCAVGCPHATHEWMFAYDVPHLVSDASVITQSKLLRAKYGY